MIRRIGLCLALLLAGCQQIPEPGESGEPRSSSSANRQFEAAIAGKLINDVRTGINQYEGAERAVFLREGHARIIRSVDLTQISEQARREIALIAFLRDQSDLLTFGSGYESRLRALTSLDWEWARYERTITGELDRIDQTIAVLADEPPTTFKLSEHMEITRSSANYPQDSFSGRQDYLDTLSADMIKVQADWFDSFQNYDPSELAIYGEEQAEQMFLYSRDGLTINLDNVSNLPLFETRCLAVFYGFPGLQRFQQDSLEVSNTQPDAGSDQKAAGLRNFVKLPAYTAGWAAFMLDLVAIHEVDNTLNCLYFSRLLTALALADLYIHRGERTKTQIVDQLYEQLPYSRERINLMVNQVEQDPGYFAAMIAGKHRFESLQQRCLNHNGCQDRFSQTVVDLGPVPFDLLEAYLFQ